MTREFDVIIFGASGWTGGFVVEELAMSMNMDSLYKSNNLKMAVAGRSRSKIETTLSEAVKNTGIDWITNVPIIEADVDKYETLLDMCKRTRLIITVVGPYRFFGEPLVKASVEGGCNYVDISGEPQFLENMQLKYHKEANEKGVYIVGACGFDSIPADLGITWTKQQCTGDLNAVEVFLTVDSPDGIMLNYGTWHSAIYGCAKYSELRPLREKLFKDVLHGPPTKSIYPAPSRRVLSRVSEVPGWSLPFPGSDKSVIKRSEIMKYDIKKERPVLCETYVQMQSIPRVIAVAFAAAIFGMLVYCSPGRYLLKSYPKIFSFGTVHQGTIKRSSLQKMTFSHTIIGYGWDEKITVDSGLQHSSKPKKKIVTRIKGPDPGYYGTASLLVHAGMTLLFDREKLPPPGVITPGACFADTYLIDRLSKRGITFDVLEKL